MCAVLFLDIAISDRYCQVHIFNGEVGVHYYPCASGDPATGRVNNTVHYG